jgi:hypothetical protein
VWASACGRRVWHLLQGAAHLGYCAEAEPCPAAWMMWPAQSGRGCACPCPCCSRLLPGGGECRSAPPVPAPLILLRQAVAWSTPCPRCPSCACLLTAGQLQTAGRGPGRAFELFSLSGRAGSWRRRSSLLLTKPCRDESSIARRFGTFGCGLTSRGRAPWQGARLLIVTLFGAPGSPKFAPFGTSHRQPSAGSGRRQASAGRSSRVAARPLGWRDLRPLGGPRWHCRLKCHPSGQELLRRVCRTVPIVPLNSCRCLKNVE